MTIFGAVQLGFSRMSLDVRTSKGGHISHPDKANWVLGDPEAPETKCHEPPFVVSSFLDGTSSSTP